MSDGGGSCCTKVSVPEKKQKNSVCVYLCTHLQADEVQVRGVHQNIELLKQYYITILLAACRELYQSSLFQKEKHV